MWLVSEYSVSKIDHVKVAVVIDGMQVVHGFPQRQLSETWDELAAHMYKKMSAMVREWSPARVDVVFDSYPAISIKSPEHDRRNTGALPTISQGAIDQKLKIKENEFREILYSSAKRMIVEFLTEE